MNRPDPREPVPWRSLDEDSWTPPPGSGAPPSKGGCRLLTLLLIIPTLCLFPILLPLAGMVAVIGGSWRWTNDTPKETS